MKIALVSPYDYAYPGGVSIHVAQLAAQFTQGGHSVHILTPSSKPSGSARIIRLGRPVPIPSGGSMARISLSLWLLPKIRALLEREQFDVVHLHEPLAPFLPLAVLHYSKSVNVGTFHAFHGSGRLYGVSRFFLTGSMAKLHGRIAVSAPALRFVARHFPAEYRLIPNGIDMEHFSRPAVPLPELADGKLNILFVGRMERRKGLQYLLAAYSRLKWEFPDLRLVVVGPGTPDKDTFRVMGARNIRDVVFVGAVPYSELPRYYQAGHIFCSPATGKESFGMILLEAMAAGRPIVASRIEGYASVLTHGGEGLMVRPRDEAALAGALRRLIVNPELRQRLGQAGQAKAREYSWAIVSAKVMEYYRELLERRRVSPDLVSTSGLRDP
ncbi:MAG: glycosyltransferase family 4 protein [Chloroflexi bacterium]|nr:glycosyltransferase family 4 protein [Chloroflexota bacterium]